MCGQRAPARRRSPDGVACQLLAGDGGGDARHHLVTPEGPFVSSLDVDAASDEEPSDETVSAGIAAKV